MSKILPITLRVLKDDSAVVSIMLAGTMLFGIAVAGFAVDYGRAEFAKVELQNALDAGALAGARSSPLTSAQITKEALTYFGANWGAPFGSHVVDGSGNRTQPNFVVNTGLTQIVSTASINVNTTMLWAIGQKTMLAKGFNVVDLPTLPGLEVAMVLDNTGSQAQGCKMNYIVQAAQEFVNFVYRVPNLSTTNVIQPPSSSNCTSGYAYTIPGYSPPAEVTPPPGTWISVVPFVTSVAPVAPGSTDMTNWVNNHWIDTAHQNEFPSQSSWQGCVEARLFTAPGDMTNDAYGGEDPVATGVTKAVAAFNGVAENGNPVGTELAPSQAPFTRYFYPSDNDVLADPGNPSWAPNNFLQVTNYDLKSGSSSGPTAVLTTANLQANNPGTAAGSKPLLVKGAFQSGGSPNAPLWPTFNVWDSTTVGTSSFFNDNVAQSQFNLQSFINGAGSSEVLVGSSNTSTYPYMNQFEITSSVTDQTQDCSKIGISDCFPIFVPGIPSNPPGATYNRGPNLGCPTPILPFSTDYSATMTAIANMFPDMVGGTVTNVGLAWGYRVLSPNWQGVWTAGASSIPNNINQTLPLPYNIVIPNPAGGQLAVQKIVVFLTDGDNEWGLQVSGGNDGDNTYTAYKTLDHTPLLDQMPPWTNSTNVSGGIIPAPFTSDNLAARANLAVDPPASFTAINSMNGAKTVITPPTMDGGGDGLITSQTAEAWNLCQEMQRDGITIYTILLEFNDSDISKVVSDGYSQYCATDPGGGGHFFELQGAGVSNLANVFQSIGNSITTLRLAQ